MEGKKKRIPINLNFPFKGGERNRSRHQKCSKKKKEKKTSLAGFSRLLPKTFSFLPGGKREPFLQVDSSNSPFSPAGVVNSSFLMLFLLLSYFWREYSSGGEREMCRGATEVL